MTPSEFEFQVELAIAICKDKGTMPPAMIHISTALKNALLDNGLLHKDSGNSPYIRYKGMVVSWSSMFKDKFELVDAHMITLIIV